jgi:hypothetical protein
VCVFFSAFGGAAVGEVVGLEAMVGFGRLGVETGSIFCEFCSDLFFSCSTFRSPLGLPAFCSHALTYLFALGTSYFTRLT